MACIVHMSVLTLTTARCSISLWCLPSSFSVLRWKNCRMCGRHLAPLSGITLTTRAIRSQHYTLSNSYKLVRAPRLLCRCRPPHYSHMVQRLQALCPAHRLHTVPPSPKVQTGTTRTVTSDLLSATLAEAATQLSFAAILERCISVKCSPAAPSYQSPHHLWMPLRRLFHTSLSPRTFLHATLV